MLTNLNKKIKALSTFSFEDETKRIIEANKGKLADLQAEQLAQGIRSDGQRINPGYSPFTIQQKRGRPGLSGITDRVTFFDTGETYSLLRAVVGEDRYRITADTFKFEAAIKRSGVKVFGLTKDSRREFINQIVRPRILQKFRSKVTDI